MNFDIAQLDTRTRSEAGQPMELLHPRSGAPILGADKKPVTITLLGPNSEKSRAVNREMAQRRADKASRGVKMEPEDFERERFDVLTALTVGWTFDMLDGKEFPFNDENCRAFWSDGRWAWVQTQAWGFCQGEGNFLPS